MIWNEKAHSIYKQRKQIGKVVVGYLGHLMLLFAVVFVIPNTIFGTIFAASSIITGIALSAVAYVFGVLSYDGLIGKLYPDLVGRKFAAKEALFHGIYGVISIVWLLLPACIYLGMGGHVVLMIPLWVTAGANIFCFAATCYEANR